MQRPLAVVYAGRFQPFHAGHYAAWTSLCQRFGPETCWLATSDRTGKATAWDRAAPFGFEEKRRIITGLFPVPPERVVRVRSPYAPAEVLAPLGPDVALVAALGARDADRLSSRYWRTYAPDAPLLPAPEAGYVLVLPEQAGGLSGTALRAALGDVGRPRPEREALFRDHYPVWNEEIATLILDRLEQTSQERP